VSSANVNGHRIFLFFSAFAVGVISGLRSMTALAVISWAARWGWLDLHSTPLAFLGTTWFAYAITVFAAGELMGDKLPWIPDRTSSPALVFRLITGGLSGAAIFVSARQSLVLGATLGALGALAGAFEGYHLRRRLTKEKGLPDFAIAIAEDLIAVGGAFLLVSHLY
jgi:uncharacterized membrane protein